MDYLQSVRTLRGAALSDFSQAIYERDVRTFNRLIAELTRLGTPRDFETAAEMLSVVPMKAARENNTYMDARYGSLADGDYLNMYFEACAENGVTEREYMPLLLYAQYAPQDSALHGWDKSVDRYIEDLARNDFDLAADYIDAFDKKFGKYTVLIAVDKPRAINRLVGMALYGKSIDKAAVRDILMDYDVVTDALIALFAKSCAHDRVAIVRLLSAFKNDSGVREFLTDVAISDPSKTVRAAAKGVGRSVKPSDPLSYMERLMAEGIALTYGEWKLLFEDERYREIADRIFFLMSADGDVKVLVYNDGQFLDSSDTAVTPDDMQDIFVLHPLDVPENSLDILSIKIDQPFLQINRPIFQRGANESSSSTRFAGTMIARDEFAANMKKYGFSFCDKRSDADPDIAVCKLGEYVVGVECDLPKSSYTVSCGKTTFYNASDIVKIKRKAYISTARPLDVHEVPRRVFSELMYCVSKLFGNV